MAISKSKLSKIKVLALDFDGVFTDNKVIVDQNGVEHVICSRADGIGISNIKKKGIIVYIVSSEVNNVVKKRAKKLEIDCFHGVKDKGVVLEKVSKSHNIKPENILFLGNDINDIPAFDYAGISVGVNDSHPGINSHIDFKLSKNGGDGAVRELCDLIIEGFDG